VRIDRSPLLAVARILLPRCGSFDEPSGSGCARASCVDTIFTFASISYAPSRPTYRSICGTSQIQVADSSSILSPHPTSAIGPAGFRTRRLTSRGPRLSIPPTHPLAPTPDRALIFIRRLCLPAPRRDLAVPRYRQDIHTNVNEIFRRTEILYRNGIVSTSWGQYNEYYSVESRTDISYRCTRTRLSPYLRFSE